MRRTKIVATISDLNCEIKFIRQLYDAGMNIARLNTAHQSTETTQQIINNIRAVSDKIAIIIDTKGPELRTCKVEEEFLIKSGEKIKIAGNDEAVSTRECIYVRYNNLVADVPSGSTILIDDGKIELFVERKDEEYLHCVAVHDGIIQSRKSMNIPNVRLNLPALSRKDLNYIYFAIENDIEFIAHSFVRNKEDVLQIQKILDDNNSKVKIIAKIENQEGVDNLDEILDYVYGVMVARGDLAVEIPYEKIPVIQRDMIRKCIAKRKPVIIATQMLHSMINAPRPTRAEVSDIANAIYSQADALMLSNETAGGCFPIEAVKTMAKVAEEVEKDKKSFEENGMVVLTTEISAFLTKSAVRAAAKLDAKAIIADTLYGRTIRNLAGFRGEKPVYARCYDQRVMRELSLSYGIFPDYMRPLDSSPEFINDTLHDMLKKKILTENDLVVVVAGNFGTYHGASFIEISTVVNLLKTNKISVDFAYAG